MRTRSIVTGVLTLVALGLAATPAAAQHEQTRAGFWAGLGMGWGSFGLSCDACDGLERTGSDSGYFKLGGTLRPNLLLGAELNGWTKSEGWRLGRARQRVGRGLLVPHGAVRPVPQGRGGLFPHVGG